MFQHAEQITARSLSALILAASLAERGVTVNRADLEPAEGVDIVGDVFDGANTSATCGRSILRKLAVG